MSPLRLKNPLQSRSSFSDTDVRNLVPLPKERHRLRHHYEWDAAYVSKGDMLDEIPYRPSISDRITKSGILCDAKNKREVSAIMSIIFIEIFYQALRKHFVCPICNEFLHKVIHNSHLFDNTPLQSIMLTLLYYCLLALPSSFLRSHILLPLFGILVQAELKNSKLSHLQEIHPSESKASQNPRSEWFH